MLFRSDCSVALQALREGRLPLRVTHNDTKLNNVLMDEETGEGVCVVDLDTVMPGLSINDFGDSIRFGANHCTEDERDLNKVGLDLHLFELYTQAFLEGAGGTLTEEEIAGRHPAPRPKGSAAAAAFSFARRSSVSWKWGMVSYSVWAG